MKNKILLIIIFLLCPFTFLINNKDNTKSDIKVEDNIIVNLKRNDEIISLNLDEYIIGVVGKEMPASFYDEALKAQAVAARTFAYNYLEGNEINISDKIQGYASINELKEKWQNDFDKYYNKIKNIVLSLDNEVIKYNGDIIKSYYYAISNGKTEDVMEVFNEELPYIEVVDSSFDSNVNKFEVTTSFSRENFCSLLNIECNDIKINDITKDESNRVKEITINSKKFSGIDVRKKLSLRSTDFNIEINNNQILITTKGYGHGVGMSQYGANYLASINYSYKDILNYYYKNIVIENY